MSEKEISESLYHLRHAIQAMANKNPDASAALEGLLDQLEDQLESSSDGRHLHLVEDMKGALTEFEVEHPAITATLNQLMVSLGGMGI